MSKPRRAALHIAWDGHLHCSSSQHSPAAGAAAGSSRSRLGQLCSVGL